MIFQLPESVLEFPGVQVRYTTLAIGLVILTVWLARRKPTHAVVAFCAWLFGYEIAWQWTVALVHGGPYTNAVVQVAGVAGWLVASWAIGIRPHPYWSAATVVLWLIWVSVGFPVNAKGGVRIDVGAEALNVLTKSCWGMAYVMRKAPVRAWEATLWSRLRLM